MSRFRINSTFETFGAFWVYGQPGKKFTGSASSRKGTVELHGCPEYTELNAQAMRTIFAEVDSAPGLEGSAAICGFTTLNLCTLLNPVRLSGGGLADIPTMQKVDRVRYRAMRTVMGLHLESSEAAILDGAAYYLSKIHQVLPSPWQTKFTQDGMEHTVSNRANEIFKFRSEYLGAEVVCEVFAGGGKSIKKGVEIKPVPRIKITPDEPQSVDWFTSLAFRLENFFSLILGTSVEIEHVQVFQGEQDGWVVQKVNGRKEKIDRQTWVQCKFEDTASALNRWFAVPRDDQPVELALLGALRKSDLFEETEFLTLAQSLEGFGRIRFGGTRRREVKFGTIIKETYNLFTSETAKKLAGDREAFVQIIIQTRDYYTHLGNPKGNSVAKTLKELFLLNKRLHACLRGAMLLDLGIPEDAFSQAIIYQATRWR